MKRIRNRLDLAAEIKSIVLEPLGEIRGAIGRIVRRECKDFLAEYGELYLDQIRGFSERMIGEQLASLGSAGLPAGGQLEREVRRALTRLENDHRKVLYTLPAEKVCWNSACDTREPVPHMLDERDHRSTGDVMKEKL